MLQRVLLAALFLTFIPWVALANDGGAELAKVPAVFRPLVERLIRDGFDREFVIKVYSDPRTAYLSRVVATNLKRIEKPADYAHFLSRPSVQEGRSFLEQYRPLLERVESTTGVAPEVLVAILYVESRFGKDVGRHRVFNVFSSLAVAEAPALYGEALRYLRSKYPGTTAREIRRRAKRKAQWAYSELVALLRLATQQRLDVHELRGSWAGAFGIPQFIPTSYLNYAVDGDGDGQIDLSALEDAAASIGAYLKQHGWRSRMSRRQRLQALMKYNNSRLYASTILAYAEKLGYRP